MCDHVTLSTVVCRTVVIPVAAVGVASQVGRGCVVCLVYSATSWQHAYCGDCTAAVHTVYVHAHTRIDLKFSELSTSVRTYAYVYMYTPLDFKSGKFEVLHLQHAQTILRRFAVASCVAQYSAWDELI